MMTTSVSEPIIGVRPWQMGAMAVRFFTEAWFAFIIDLLFDIARSFDVTP